MQDGGARHIPDPEILRPAHIAVSLADLAPRLRHPETGQTLAKIAQGLPDAGLRPREDVDLLWQ